jgi:hypothetical protein
VSFSVFAGDHLRIHVRFGAVQIAESFQIGRTDFPVILKGLIAASQNRFGDHDPGIVMTEDSGIFLVARRIG